MSYINCPECGHDIDGHERYEGILGRTCYVYNPAGFPDCTCKLTPSDIARALLAAEPADTQIEAAAQSLYDCNSHNWLAWDDQPIEVRVRYHDLARAVLKAARDAR